jgi:hypothetical protein
METLTRDNYEGWFLDYLDGQLTNDQIDILLDFLAVNPDLREELSGVTGAALPAGSEIFTPKASLLKSANDIPGISTTDQLCIARMEGDLTEAEAAAFDTRIMEDARLERVYSEFLLTKLDPARHVVYPGKGELRKKSIVFTPWLVTGISAAAIILLALFLWPRAQEVSAPELAKTNQPAATTGQPAPESGTAAETPDLIAGNSLSESPVSGEKAVRQGASTKAIPAEIIETAPVTREFIQMESLAGRTIFPVAGIPQPETPRLLYASSYAPVLSIPSPEDVLTLPQLALQLFRSKVLGQDPGLVKKTRFSMWEVAGAGVDKINALAGTDMKLGREYDDNGQILAVSFNSRLLDVAAPVRGQSAR